ncbi:M28 family peptidase [Singulisphaera rosea]
MSRRSLMPFGRKLQLSVAGLSVLLAIGSSMTLFHPFADWDNASEASENVAPTPAPIDGTRAFNYLKTIFAMGPRPAGTPANAKLREMVAKHFRAMGGEVHEQRFSSRHPTTGVPIELANLIGSWHPERTRRVMVGAHYDTRPFPDQDKDPARRAIPFIGANDPASGIALLMEIAHHLKDLPTGWGIDLVLFDAEELVYGQDGEYFLGSKEFARVYVEDAEGRKNPIHYDAGIVLDLIGGRDARISQEPYSLDFAPRIVQEVWSIARRLKANAFRNRVGRAVLDDHLALNNGGIPAIDLIDFDYPYWHTSRDIPENCSATSLVQVGRVVTAWLAQNPPKRR